MPQQASAGVSGTWKRPDDEDLAGLPGADLVLAGMEELRTGQLTAGALLVLVAAPRLRRLGFELPERSDIPRPYEHQLYALLEQTHGRAAYSRYGSLIRRIVSFSRTLQDRRRRASRRPGEELRHPCSR